MGIERHHSPRLLLRGGVALQISCLQGLLSGDELPLGLLEQRAGEVQAALDSFSEALSRLESAEHVGRTRLNRGYLHLQGIPYIYRNVELDPDADEWNRSFNGGDRVTPVILVGDPASPSAVLIEPSDEDLGAAIKGS